MASQLLNSLPEAEDAVQEAFVRLVREALGPQERVAFVMELRENRIASIAPVADPELLAKMKVEWNP